MDARSRSVKNFPVAPETESTYTRVAAVSVKVPLNGSIFCGSGMTVKVFALAAKMVAVNERRINAAI